MSWLIIVLYIIGFFGTGFLVAREARGNYMIQADFAFLLAFFWPLAILFFCWAWLFEKVRDL